MQELGDLHRRQDATLFGEESALRKDTSQPRARERVCFGQHLRSETLDENAKTPDATKLVRRHGRRDLEHGSHERLALALGLDADGCEFGSHGDNITTPGAWRFDAPTGVYGVLYAGEDVAAAFIETFGHATGARVPPFVTERELAARRFSRLEASRPLRLVDIRGSGLARMGADGGLSAGEDYTHTQRWSEALYDHPRIPDGILFRARHDLAKSAVALFEDRVGGGLTETSLGTLLDPSNASELGGGLERYKFGLVP